MSAQHVDMETFFTRADANAGIRLPLSLPDGTPTGHWLHIRGTDSDAFRRAEARGRRALMDAAEERDGEARQERLAEARLDLLVSLAAGWSFEAPCAEPEIRRLPREAPRIAEQVDRAAADHALFFGVSSKGSTTTPAGASSRSELPPDRASA